MRNSKIQLTRHDGAVFTFEVGGVSIGRHRSNDIILSDPSISRHHARVWVSHDSYWIRDENSAGGTFVNGQSVQGQQQIHIGDVIQIGDTSLRLDPAPSHPKRSPANNSQTALVWVALGGLVVLLGAFFLLGGSGPLPPSEGGALLSNTEPEIGFVAGSLETSGEGAAQFQMHDGTEATVAFVNQDGEPVEDVQADYVSDESGVTIFSNGKEGDYFPSIQYFSSEKAQETGYKNALPVEQNISDYDYEIQLEDIQFDEEITIQRTTLNLDHLEQLPQNFSKWKFERNLCIASRFASVIHLLLSPGTKIAEVIITHGAVEVLCHHVFQQDPQKVVSMINSQNRYGIVKVTAEDQAYLIGQVADQDSDLGIPGAVVDAGEYHSASALSNGWYYLTLPWGENTITASATGYESASRHVSPQVGMAQVIEPIYLEPSQQTASLGRGDVKVTLRWYTEDDLDLHVFDPDGNEIYYRNDQVDNGGQLDVDSNAACSDMTDTPVENIFWPSGGAPEGSYEVSVVYYMNCVSSDPVDFEVTIHVDGRTQSYSGVVSEEDQDVSVTEFTR
jgi:hypothetical protein